MIEENKQNTTDTIETTKENKTIENGAVLPTTEPTKNKGGRPTIYTPELCNRVDDYLAESIDKEKATIKEVTNNDGTVDIKETLRFSVQLPTIEGFALFLGVNKTTLYEWEEKYPEFSNSLSKIKDIQKSRLLNEGLAGNYNSTIAKLILSSNHGMAENTHTDITSKGKSLNNPVTVIFQDMSEEE